MSKNVLSLIGTELSAHVFRLKIPILATLLICPICAWSATIEEPLYKLLGGVPKDELIDLGGPIGKVIKVSIRLSGQLRTGTYDVLDSPEHKHLGGCVEIDLSESENDSWNASKCFDHDIDLRDEEIEFEWCGVGEPSWSFLEDGEAQIKAYLGYNVHTHMINLDKPKANFYDVWLIIDTAPADVTPPDPDPMIWAKVPYQTGTTSISMEAIQATDETPPVIYYFDFYDSPTSGSVGRDSGWITSPSYTDTGLGINHKYRYRVRAGDSASPRNEGSYSDPIRSVYTDIEKPTGIKFSTITPDSVTVESENTPSGLSRENSGLLIENITRGTNSGWRQNNNSWNSRGLSVNTLYGFRARARNGDGDETDNCDTEYRYTHANIPGTGLFADISGNSIRVTWTHNGNPSSTNYFCENITNGTNSGWIQNTSWTNTGLSPDIQYSYRIKARNGDNIETDWRSLGSAKISHEECSITVTSPIGGENWRRGTTHNITWDSDGNVDSNVKVELYKGVTRNLIINSSTSNDESYSWLIPQDQAIGSDYRIKITSTSNSSYYDYSDNYFTIPGISVTSPNGDEIWFAGTSKNITWNSVGNVGSDVKIELYKSGSFNRSIKNMISNNYKSFTWSISSDLTPGEDYTIRITSVSEPDPFSDESDNYFSIHGPPITVISPNGGEIWQAGKSYEITWTAHSCVGARVKIHLYKEDDIYNGIAVSDSSIENGSNGSHIWDIPSDLPPGSNYKVRITSTSNDSFLDESDNYFSIIIDGNNVIFEDTFPSTTIDRDKWNVDVVDGATVDDMGINMPSPPYSLRLNGDPSGGDLIESNTIDLSQYSGATFTYHYQHTGNGNPPRVDEDLILEYFDGSSWDELDRQLGNGSKMTSYESSTIDLPPEALHENFKFRMKRSEGISGSYGDWFVDNIKIEISEDEDNNVYPVKLIASESETGDQFGQSVSISGDYAIVGASHSDENRGSAYIFERSSEDWIQQIKLNELATISPAKGDYFGCDVCINGNYAIIGAHGQDYNGTDSGTIYIFNRTVQGWILLLDAVVVLLDVEEGDHFGCAVSISGDYTIVGSYGDDEGRKRDAGSAHVLQRTGTSWLEKAYKLTASDASKYDWFGCSVSINGDYAIVGASLHDDSIPGIDIIPDCGAAYIFKNNGEGWIQKAKLLPANPNAGDEFGGSVSINGNYAVVGAICDDTAGEDAGAAYIFECVDDDWTQRAKLTPSDPDASGDYFGSSVSIDGDYVVIGASLDDDLGEDSGTAYIYKREDLTWELQVKLTAPDGAQGDNFGHGVSISGSYVLVGAPNDDDKGENSGSVYIFKRTGTKWMP